MLYIRFGSSDKSIEHVSGFFRNMYEREWFDDPLVREMIRDVDKSEVIAGTAIDSPVLGVISPLELSGGVKTLILMLFEPEYEYYATACGDNCGKWMIEIGKRQDVHISLTRFLRFRPPEERDVGGMNVICVNSGKSVNTMRELLDEFSQYLRTREGD